MGIFRAGVRVNRALTPTPSSSSSDDEEPRPKKQCNLRRNSVKMADVRDLHQPDNEDTDGTDLFQVGDTTCRLPEELLKLEDLGSVLSLETWNDCLSEEERQSLCAYLPDMDQDTYQITLKELFEGENFNFGSPMMDLLHSLRDGSCNPSVVDARQTLWTMQRKEYYHNLRLYHNGMVSSLLEMRKLWSTEPGASLEERLRTWKDWKSRKSCSAVASESIVPQKLYVPPQKSMKKNRGGAADRRKTRVGEQVLHSRAQQLHEDFGSRSRLDKQFGSEVDQDFFEEDNIEEPYMAEEQPFSFVREAPMVKKKKKAGSSRNKVENDYGEMDHLAGVGMEAAPSSMKFKSSKVHKSSRKNEHMNIDDRHFNMQASAYSEENIQYYNERDFDRDSESKGMEIGLRESQGSGHARKNRNRSLESDEFLLSPHADSMDDEQSGAVRKDDLSYIPASASSLPFSPIHFISAVRAAILDPVDIDSDELEYAPPSVNFLEIVRRVEVNPGDARVLDMQLLLDGVIKGVMKVLSCTLRKPLLKGLRPFAAYDKSIRCWTWIGPLPANPLCFEETDEHSFLDIWCTSPETLYEIQDAFCKWLKSSEKYLYQVAQLALIPMPVFPILPDEKERFKDLRAQKSLNTIVPSTPEMRSLFRKEELVRYSASDMAFSYTAADGRKSAVAPLRRMGGKSKAKARDHFMLKPDRPSHITVLCLVRDAAARLPQGIGTRADVCTLLRDSQFIVDDVPEAQLSQVVSGALDRLHYEKDPCVRYDSDKKLWLYLHADRQEEDFDEAGTTSTRSSKRSKKDGVEITSSPMQGNGYTEDLSEAELDSGSYNCSSGVGGSASPELLYNHQNADGQGRDEVLLPFIDLPASMQPFCGNMQSHPMGWEVYKAGKELSITQ